MFRLADFQLLVWFEVLIGLLALSAFVYAGSDQEHCFVPAPSDEDTDLCPPWFIQQEIAGDNATVECVCGPPTDGIVCNPKTCNTSLHIEYCITYDSATRTQVVGACQFQSNPNFMTTLPTHIKELNEFMCGHFNREGQLCGKCKPGYGSAILSLDPMCVNCTTKGYGWGLYLAVEFLPITVFYMVIVIFQVSATSGPLNAFIFSAQIIVTTINVNKTQILAYSTQPWSQVILQILIFSYDFWNLDFFRSVIPPFCVSDKITDLHLLALQYLPAVYPLLLIAGTYILIELHDKNVRVVVCLWRPFRQCFAPLQGRWNPKASIVSSFATFLTVAYNKLIVASFGLLNRSKITDIRGNSSQYLMVAPTVPYFGNEHLPFAILAIAVLSTLIALPPLLLLIYPTQTFQKLLGCLKIRWPALHIFADVFQGCYKNRTDGRCDFRYFAAFYFILRVVIFLVRTLKPEVLIWTISAVCLGIGSLLFALLRPYKKNWLNILDSLILALLALISLWIVYCLETHEKWFQSAGLLTALPLVYFVVYTAYRLLSWLGVLQKFQQKSRNIWQSLQQRWLARNVQQQEPFDEDQLPDRLLNPCQYQPLPQNAQVEGEELDGVTESLPIIHEAYTNDYGSTS